MALSREQTERYSNDGFLIVEDLLSRQELQPAMDDIAEIVDELAKRLHATGRISSLHSNHGFDKASRRDRGRVSGGDNLGDAPW